MKDLAKIVINRIKTIDIDLYKALQSALASPEETCKLLDKLYIVRNLYYKHFKLINKLTPYVAKPLHNASIYQSTATILRPLVRSLFVGE